MIIFIGNLHSKLFINLECIVFIYLFSSVPLLHITSFDKVALAICISSRTVVHPDNFLAFLPSRGNVGNFWGRRSFY